MRDISILGIRQRHWEVSRVTIGLFNTDAYNKFRTSQIIVHKSTRYLTILEELFLSKEIRATMTKKPP